MLKRTIQLSIGIALLTGLCLSAGMGELWEVIRNIRFSYIVLLLLLSGVLITVSCIKWQLFVRAAGHDESLLRLVRFYTMSYFFNLFMPSLVGGDVVRSMQLGSRIGNYTDAFAVTFVERFTGFLAMNIVGIVFVLAGARATADVEVAVLSIGFLTALAALILFSERASRLCGRFAVRMVRGFGGDRVSEKLTRGIDLAIAGMAFARRNDRLFLLSMFYSLAFHFFAVVNTYVAALSVGWDGAEFGSLCVVVPLVLLVSVAPITPSAIGVQEGAFVYFLVRIGATDAEALGVGLVLRAKNIFVALIGGLIWMSTPRARDGERSGSISSAPESCVRGCGVQR